MFYSEDGNKQHFILKDKNGISTGRNTALCGERLQKGLASEKPFFKDICKDCFKAIKDDHLLFIIAHRRGGLFRNEESIHGDKPGQVFSMDGAAT